MQTIQGILQTIKQQKAVDNGQTFIMASMLLSDRSTVTIAGPFLNTPETGANISLNGNWIDHNRHGHLFRFYKGWISSNFTHQKNKDFQGERLSKPAVSESEPESYTVICGELSNIRYKKDIDDMWAFCIAELKVKKEPKPICILGEMVKPVIGDHIKLTGQWLNHPKFGRQFKFSLCEMVTPDSIDGIEAVLSSGRIRGIGAKLAKRIVKQFQMKTFDIIANEPERLKQVNGIGDEKLKRIVQSYQEQEAIIPILKFLQQYGISCGFANKICKRYGLNAISVVSQNPYKLAEDIPGIGFKSSDDIAKAMGFDSHSPFRIKAAVLYTLREKNKQGHAYYPFDLLTTEATQILGLGANEVRKVIEHLDRQRIEARTGQKKADRFIYIERTENKCSADDPVWTPKLYHAEFNICQRLKGISFQLNSNHRLGQSLEKAIKKFEYTTSITLAKNQKKAVETACNNKICVITGGPGTGKTTLIKCIASIYESRNKSVVMCAPTGRAANRMNEATGRMASTIHRLLEFSYAEGFLRNENNPLDGDLFVVDETSMVDTYLMSDFLKAIPAEATLILVGDINQLPSVGPGNVLTDIITSGKVPVVELSHIFRQAEQSTIITNAHKINHGQMPDMPGPSAQNDFWFYHMTDPIQIQQQIVSIAIDEIKKLASSDHCQVLTPMHRGPLGTQVLNDVLQKALNPQKLFVQRGSVTFNIHDKVMQIRNNYNKQVFNGDIGHIANIDTDEKVLTVKFGSRQSSLPVEYDFSELNELVLAYASTIHKSQGSEFETVIIPVTTSHFIMLARNLIYTAVTRGKKKVVVLGSKKAMGIAVNNNKIQQRFTRLKQRLIGQEHGTQ
ncbi:MAG: ATP-dependent RecD-like DNA helicase [Desulfobacteraceae bacterium]|nr:ATP-dependent RecD-like DNA helicase [Desulfobacteraceae bacterium]